MDQNHQADQNYHTFVTNPDQISPQPIYKGPPKTKYWVKKQ